MSEGTSADMAPVPGPPASAASPRASADSGRAFERAPDVPDAPDAAAPRQDVGHPVAPEGIGPGAPWPPEPESTGDDDVDAQLALLRHLPGLPVAEHGDFYATLHDGLRSALDDMPRES